MNPATDKDLVAAALAGDGGAWEELVRRHYGLVFGIGLAWLGEVEAAEDLAQEVFLRLFVQLKNLRDGERLAPWAARAARNLASNWKRDRQTRSRLIPMIAAEEATMAEVPDTSPSARDRAAREEQQRLVCELVATLPEEERELVVLHFMEGCSQRELARKLGVNVSTVSRRLDASLKKLRDRFENVAAESLRCDEGARGRAAARAGALATAYMALPDTAKAAVVAEVSKLTVPVGAAATTASLYTGVALMSAKSTAISVAIAAAIVVMLVVGGVVVTNLPDRADRSETVTEQVDARQVVDVEAGRESATTTPRGEAAQGDESISETLAEEAGIEKAEASRDIEEVTESYDGITLVVRGRVMDANRRPIEGAEVRLSKVEARALTGYYGAGHPVVAGENVETTAISGANGAYELRSRRGLPLQLAALADGHRIELEGVNDRNPNLRPLTSETQLLERDFLLPPATALHGRVVNDDDNPVDGATVEANYVSGATFGSRPLLQLSTETDAQGEFVFESLGMSRVRLDVEKEGMGKARHTVESAHMGEVVVRLSREAQSVSGIVTDWEGETVSGATVSIGSAVAPNYSNPDPVWFETTSADDGTFLIESVPADSYYITATTSDGRRSLSRENRSFVPVNVSEGSNEEGITLRLFDGYEVSGTVRDALTGDPIAGAKVAVIAMSLEEQQSTVTDGEGRYVLSNVQGTPDFGSGISLTLIPSRNGFRFPKGDRNRREPQLRPEPGQRAYMVDLELISTVEWSGRVLTPDRRPAAGARVASVGEDDATTTTNQRGEFTLEVAVNRTAQVVATLSGFPPTYSEPVDIGTDAPSDVEIRLDPGATAVLHVEDESGNPVRGAAAGLMIRTYGGSWSSASRHEVKATGLDGRAKIEELPTRDFPISILHNRQSIDFFAHQEGYGTPDEARGEEFTAGERREIVIVLPPLDESGVIAGHVTDPDGRPLANVQVNLDKQPNYFQATTGSDGRFRKDKIPAGTYHLSFHHVEFGHAGESAETGTEDLVVVLGKDNVMLTVLLVDGETGETVTGGRVESLLQGGTPVVGLSDIPGAHRFPNHRRQFQFTFRATAPGYAERSVTSPEIPDGEREFIMTVEMERVAPE